MSRRIFIDTQFVVALINAHDLHHTEAVQLADLHENESFIVTDAVLLEVGNALARKFKSEAIRIISDFLTTDGVEVVRLSENLFNEAFAFYKSHVDKDWGFIDCISFVVMRKEGIQDALTMDQHFRQAGFEVLMKHGKRRRKPR